MLEEASKVREKIASAKRTGTLMYVGFLVFLLGFLGCAGIVTQVLERVL